MTDRPSIRNHVCSPRNVISFLLGLGLLVLTVRSVTTVDVDAALTSLQEADPLWFVAALCLFQGLGIVRSLRWQLLLENVGYTVHGDSRIGSLTELTRIIYLGWFANCVTVARLGDVYRCSVLHRSTDADISVTAGTVLTERIVDIAILVVALVAAVIVVFWGDVPPAVLQTTMIGTGLLIVVISGLLVIDRAGRSFDRWLPGRVQRIYRRVRRGTVDSLDRYPQLVGYTAIGWLFEGMTMYLVGVALGVDLSFGGAFVAALVGVLLSTIPITPGGLGVTEAGIALVLGWVGLDPTAVAAVTICYRLISYWSVVGVGVTVYAIGLWYPISLSVNRLTRSTDQL